MQVTSVVGHKGSSDVRIYTTQVHFGSDTANADPIDLPVAADNTTLLCINVLESIVINAPQGVRNYLERLDRWYDYEPVQVRKGRSRPLAMGQTCRRSSTATDRVSKTESGRSKCGDVARNACTEHVLPDVREAPSSLGRALRRALTSYFL